MSDGILLLKLNLCYLLEFCADGVVVFMCGFFCRLECEVIHENYLLLLCVCVIVKVCFHYMFSVCFQSGGGGGAAAAVAVPICHLQVHWLWVMEVVSKTLCVCVCVCGHSEIITVTVFLFDSNYDRQYCRKRYHIPTDSSPDLEDHPYRPDDPWVLPQ